MKNKNIAISDNNTSDKTSRNKSVSSNVHGKKDKKKKETLTKEHESPIAKLMQKKIEDDKASLSEYERLKSMYDRVQRGSKRQIKEEKCVL